MSKARIVSDTFNLIISYDLFDIEMWRIDVAVTSLNYPSLNVFIYVCKRVHTHRHACICSHLNTHCVNKIH